MMSGNRISAEDYQKQQAMDLCRGQGTAMITSNLLDLPGCTHIAENFAGKLLENSNYIINIPAVR